ncbi:DUF2161 domain-containing phosphodiesterase [Cytobacillus sp. FJAT-54145]|uniref:DUF2161 domain-containing phosphodiesterase n=1 Tax=Cytobacillus spartinae TaxID=3299023 RepID=A0ABW6K5Y8_9BACI
MAAKEKIYEVDLYKPVRNYFKKQGFEVYAEVNHCDVAAVKEDELVIVELKKNLTVDLLVQATARQRITDLVYIAIPKPKYKLRSKKWMDICHLVRRLELGLILVNLNRKSPTIEVSISPGPFDRKAVMRRNKKKRERILAEIEGRNGDHNVGGSTKTKIMTAYKENCIQIASLLQKYGPLSPKKLREMGTGEKTLSILHKNYYRWFEKVERGIYKISELGSKEIEEHTEISHFYLGQQIEQKPMKVAENHDD